jgi:SsrA-binding protein
MAARPVRDEAEKGIVQNRKARHEYHLSDRIEAGIALLGTEVKSLRLGRVNVSDGFVRIENGEAFLDGLSISAYEHGTHANHEPLRRRRLLLHRREIRRLERQVAQKGYTIVPTRLYFKNGRVKVEIALARGKRQYDKRQAVRDREVRRAIADATDRR